MSRAKKPSSLADYWSGIHKALDERLLAAKEYLRHPSSGPNAENYFRDLLRQYLPHRYAVESGFVVNVGGDRSDFIDILLVDSMHVPPLSAESHFKVFPAEAVVGAVEITSAVKSRVRRAGIEQKLSKLEDDILKLAKVRNIAKDREYLYSTAIKAPNGRQLLGGGLRYSLAPRSFLITFGDEWADGNIYEKHLLNSLTSARKKQEDVWINAVLSMTHGMFYFKPFTSFDHERITENSLLEFILFVNNTISDFPTSRIDIRRYRPTLPIEVDER